MLIRGHFLQRLGHLYLSYKSLQAGMDLTAKWDHCRLLRQHDQVRMANIKV
jgi:hypothetical protein